MLVDLTDRKIQSLKAPDVGRVELSDSKRKGLRFRLSSSGRGVWMYEKRIKGGKKRKHTLGPWPALSLANARAIALELEVEAAQGIDRIADQKAAMFAAEEAKAGQSSVLDVLEAYDTLHLQPNLRTAEERRRQLDQALAPHMAKPISDITRKDLQAVVDAKAQTGRRIMANRLQAAMVAFMHWAWRRGYTDTHVGLGVSKASRETARERVPSLAEVREIWSACDGLGALTSPFVKLLILTAQRRKDIAELRWSEIDLEQRRILLAGSRTKNGKPHITHLTDAAIAEIEAARAYQKAKGIQSEFVFTTTGRTPISGISKVKTRLDKLINGEREKLGLDPMEHWRFHDLRTAFATAMAEAGEPENVVDRILNHVASGSAPSAVARVYNRAEQLPQRARVLERWAAKVDTLAKTAIISPRRKS